jgi:hypothetical protein
MNPGIGCISLASPFGLSLVIYPPVTAVVDDEQVLVAVKRPYEVTGLDHEI